MCEDLDPAVRMIAASSIAEMIVPCERSEAIPLGTRTLLALMGDPVVSVRLSVLKALAKIFPSKTTDPTVLDTVADALIDPDLEIKSAGLETLGQVSCCGGPVFG